MLAGIFRGELIYYYVFLSTSIRLNPFAKMLSILAAGTILFIRFYAVPGTIAVGAISSLSYIDSRLGFIVRID